MRIKKIVSQSRRDFIALYECEHCDAIEKSGGYDDRNFHDNVIPSMECGKCGKAADKENYRALATKYPEGMQI